MGGALATRVGLKRGRGRGNASRRLAMPSLLWQEAERFHPRSRCCSSSVVEHSLGKGEVESSILSCSTIFPKGFQSLRGRALPFPPFFDPEQNLKDASRLGEISGSKFAIRSARLHSPLGGVSTVVIAFGAQASPSAPKRNRRSEPGDRPVPALNVLGPSAHPVLGRTDLPHRGVDQIWNWQPKGGQG
jgi:hypothetical protein